MMPDLPVSVDLTPALPPVYGQGELDSCVASALAAALAVDAPFEPSRLFIHYHCRAPRFLRGGVAAVQAHGFCSEEEWPYDPTHAESRPSEIAYARAKRFRGCEAQRLPQELDELKHCLTGGRPFVCGLMLHYGFLAGAVRRTGVLPLPGEREPRLGGHAVAVVGYDDARACFRIRNSMGTVWGEQGHGWAPYAYLTDPELSTDFWRLRVH